MRGCSCISCFLLVFSEYLQSWSGPVSAPFNFFHSGIDTNCSTLQSMLVRLVRFARRTATASTCCWQCLFAALGDGNAFPIFTFCQSHWLLHSFLVQILFSLYKFNWIPLRCLPQSRLRVRKALYNGAATCHSTAPEMLGNASSFHCTRKITAKSLPNASFHYYSLLIANRFVSALIFEFCQVNDLARIAH